MKPELHARSSGTQADELAHRLLRVAGDQSVRALEALAAVLVNRLHDTPNQSEDEDDLHRVPGLCEAGALFVAPEDERLKLCRRIARRALRGSLCDPTRGATDFHRVDANPAWSRRLFPVAVFGEFLFYRR